LETFDTKADLQPELFGAYALQSAVFVCDTRRQFGEKPSMKALRLVGPKEWIQVGVDDQRYV
jgi:hypothetical protein